MNKTKLLESNVPNYLVNEVHDNPDVGKQIKKAVFQKVENTEGPEYAERIQRLIKIAKHDLYYGPIPAGDIDGDGFDWPGFEKAKDELEDFYDEHIEEYWYDNFTGELMTSEPSSTGDSYEETCPMCDGVGTIETDNVDENPEDDELCPTCNGTGVIEVEWEADNSEIYYFDKDDVGQVIFGKELNKYIY